jgi:hypothetical protein
VKGYGSLWEAAPESDQVQYHYHLSRSNNRARSAGHPDLSTLVYWFACSGGMGTPDPGEGEGEESWRKGIDLVGMGGCTDNSHCFFCEYRVCGDA